ncbi:MAG: FAD:protein FMN transferase, partial [Propionibacteriaceae bacterium]|nr:FAD:protein FMN transferase [Propionibacteriaceae bacterium]
GRCRRPSPGWCTRCATSTRTTRWSTPGDVVVHCRRTDTPHWTVAVVDRSDRTRILRTLRLRTGAVAASGTAARGAHLIDPVTGVPATGLRSATVVGPELTWADVYATAAFVKGPTALAWVASLARHATILVDTDGVASSVRSPLD